MAQHEVLILMGSDSDLPVMEGAAKVLAEFGVQARVHVASAHRTPEKVIALVAEADASGVKAIICGAGFAAHLAGVVAAHTVLPVIGVPLDASPLNGLDALLSTAQMPAGIPVATVTIGKAGAKNAGILAAEIIATSDPEIKKKLIEYRKGMAETVERKDKEIQS